MKYMIYCSLITGVICGFTFPQLRILMPYLPYFVAIMLLFNFIDIKMQYKNLLRPELIVTFLLTVVIMPLLSYYLLSLPFHEHYRIGILLVALSPSGIILLVLIRYVPDKNYDLIFSNFLFTTFGSILYIPFMVKVIIGQNIHIDSTHLLYQTALLVLGPFLASRIILRLPWPGVIGLTRRISGKAILVLVFCIVSGSLSGLSGSISWDTSLIGVSVIVLSIYIIQGGLGYFVGSLIGDKSTKQTLAMICSSRNTQLVIALALLHFPPLVIVPAIISIFLHHSTNAFWLWLFRE